MSRFAKRFGVAFVLAVLAVPATAATATADNGALSNAGPRCCL
jgi:hypothetical protein